MKTHAVIGVLSASIVFSGSLWGEHFRARQITFGPKTDSYPVISPDGQWIAFEQLQDDGPGATRLETEIWVMSRQHGLSSARRLTPAGEWSSGPSWSRDSTWISFTSDREVRVGTFYEIYTNIYKINVTTGQIIQLTDFHDSGVGPHPVWAPSGWIAFERDGDIYGVKDDGSTVARLLDVQSIHLRDAPTFLSWSPDSKQIAFDAGLNGGSGIWVGDVLSGHIHRVSSGKWDNAPDWLDNSRIIFSRKIKYPFKVGISSVKVGVCLLDLRSGRVTKLTSGNVDWLPHAAPDGGEIVFSRVRNFALRDDFNWLHGSHIFEQRLPREYFVSTHSPGSK